MTIPKLAVAILFGVVILIPAAGVSARTASSGGKAIFVSNNCTKCHSIESQGLDRAGPPPAGTGKLPPDLSAVGLKHTSDWMQKWLTKEEEMNGKKHLKKFGGTDDELSTLTTWLATLKQTSVAKPAATEPIATKPAVTTPAVTPQPKTTSPAVVTPAATPPPVAQKTAATKAPTKKVLKKTTTKKAPKKKAKVKKAPVVVPS